MAQFWDGCPPEAIEAIVSRVSEVRTIKAGEDLFWLGEPCETIFGLLKGWVILYRTFEDGRRQILHFALPPALLGFQAMPGLFMPYSAQALTEAECWTMSPGTFVELCRTYPDVGMRFTSLSLRDNSVAFDHLTNIGRRSAQKRVARLLLELFVRSRMHWPGHRGDKLTLPLTQEDIGDATGLTTVHVNRVLTELRRQDVLSFHYRRLQLLDPDRLVDIAGIDPRSTGLWTEMS